MKKLLIFVTLLVLLTIPCTAEEFIIDEYAAFYGMDVSWYQGYEPTIQGSTMTLCLPIRAERCVGNITASIGLDDPNVFLLSSQPREVTVSAVNEIYPVRLTLPLESRRKSGDFPAVITLRGQDETGQEIAETIPYIIRIRDGRPSHETMEPEIRLVSTQLDVGSEGYITLTISNPTSTLSLTGGVLSVTDDKNQVLMAGSDQLALPEILPGKSETVTVPVIVSGNAEVSQHVFTVSLRGDVLGIEQRWGQRLTIPVTQSIRLEHGDASLPYAVAGELSSATVSLMNMGKGELRNVLVKLDVPEAMNPQSVLVGTIGAGDSRQAKLTFTPMLDAEGTYSGTVTITCEDAYGNEEAQTLDVDLVVEKPVPIADADAETAEPQMDLWKVCLIVLCILLVLGLVIQGSVLTSRIHKLEEDRL